MWIKILKEAIAVLLIALSLAGAAFAFRSMMDSDQHDKDEIKSITLKDAIDHFEKGTALFADARPMRAFSEGHIAGAVNLDPYEFNTWSGDFFSRVDPDQVIIVYCEGAQCGLSLDLGEKLTQLGYERVYYLKNGWGLWKENQLPTE